MMAYVTKGSRCEEMLSRSGINAGRWCPARRDLSNSGQRPCGSLSFSLEGISMHEKDPFGDKLKDKERGEEEQFFAERERALLDKLRGRGGTGIEATTGRKETPRCPKCGNLLTIGARENRAAPTCPTCR